MNLKILALFCVIAFLSADVVLSKKNDELTAKERKLLRLLLASCELSDEELTTRRPTSRSPSSRSPSSRSPVSRSPVSRSPVSRSPVSRSPISRSPVSRSPVSRSPVSRSPVSRSPVSRSPVSRSPVSRSPVSRSPVSRSPVSRSPISRSPISRSPVSRSPSSSSTSSSSSTFLPCGGVTCHDSYFAICGSDGQTYDNECHFENAQKCDPTLSIIFYGDCSDTTVPSTTCLPFGGGVSCHDSYFAICGSDGQTYQNECYFENAQKCDPSLSIIFYGECGNSVPSTSTGQPCGQKECPLSYSPICASNWRTYYSECEFENALDCDPTLTIQFNAECPYSNTDSGYACGFRTCGDYYVPVCGSDGVTYNNECFFVSQRECDPSLKLEYPDVCGVGKPPWKEPNICKFWTCSDYDFPICTTNGTTYKNDCQFARDMLCVADSADLRLKHFGPCGSPQNTGGNCGAWECPYRDSSTCTSDGQYYQNECDVQKERVCRNPNLEIYYNWSCGTVKPDIDFEERCKNWTCPSEYKPVCANNGRTYQNECAFVRAVNCDPSFRSPYIVKQGPCDGDSTLDYYDTPTELNLP